ncbi:hypothetical protein [Burkholderia sp. BCC1977]|uniref:hypothetical protein n=1 Tax=Burkholderia sp. BCC1977 TaxID=2817440 RepID=UPI002ABE3B88|nr:hypothetical protein [Burkholderia sp. BCC1977]
MNAYQQARVRALQQALDDEVHGLWISDEMARNVLARVDAVSVVASDADADGDARD